MKLIVGILYNEVTEISVGKTGPLVYIDRGALGNVKELKMKGRRT